MLKYGTVRGTEVLVRKYRTKVRPAECCAPVCCISVLGLLPPVGRGFLRTQLLLSLRQVGLALPPHAMRLFVKRVSGQSQPFEAAPSDTLADLRATRTAENVIAPRAEAVGELANP